LLGSSRDVGSVRLVASPPRTSLALVGRGCVEVLLGSRTWLFLLRVYRFAPAPEPKGVVFIGLHADTFAPPRADPRPPPSIERVLFEIDLKGASLDIINIEIDHPWTCDRHRRLIFSAPCHISCAGRGAWGVRGSALPPAQLSRRTRSETSAKGWGWHRTPTTTAPRLHRWPPSTRRLVSSRSSHGKQRLEIVPSRTDLLLVINDRAADHFVPHSRRAGATRPRALSLLKRLEIVTSP